MCHTAHELTRWNNESATEEGFSYSLPPLMYSNSDLLKILFVLDKFHSIAKYCI